MESISYTKLYNYLRNDEDMSKLETIRTIQRIRKIAPEIRLALIQYLKGIPVDISVCGVTFKELVNNENFCATRAFLFLDWLKREPQAALRYMAIERHYSAMNISEEDADDVRREIHKATTILQEESDITA